MTPVFYTAVCTGCIADNIVELLISAARQWAADATIFESVIDARDSWARGLTPLATACHHKSGDLVKRGRCIMLLLGAGSNPALTDHNGDTALHWAIRSR